MRKTVYALALLAPLAAPAAPPDRPASAGRGPPEAAERDARREQMQKRMRLTRTLGLAEALDLTEAEALRMREVLARFDEKREPLRLKMREAREQLQKAARGDAAAQKGVDDALKRTRELRGQILALHDEQLQAITQGLTPERKARAALFLDRFRERMGRGMGEVRERVREHRFRGPGGPGGPGMGPGMGPGPRWGLDEGPELPPPFAERLDEPEDDEPI
jgi:hypothetical protein